VVVNSFGLGFIWLRIAAQDALVPCGISQSNNTTLFALANSPARLVAIVLLPTPPFNCNIPIILAIYAYMRFCVYAHYGIVF